MATIRAYTTIEQSRKLAEILPHESADMYYPNRTDIKYQGALPIEFKRGNPLLSQEIAAWSLAALLNVISDYTLQKIGKDVFVVYETGLTVIGTKDYDNPIDACYEMIIRLNELNLL